MEKAITKYFWVLNLVTLAAVAYFLAEGTGQLAAAKFGSLFENKEPVKKTPARSRALKQLSSAVPSSISKAPT